MNVPDETIIKGYTLLEPIGFGGFGIVYRAHQSIVDREVAIKVILPEYANQPEFIRRFDAEAHLVGHLESPYIVPLYDYWREPDGAYLVMRYLRGGNLHEHLILNGVWGLKDAARFLDQMASALAVAHRNGVVHQDIKPGNILLDDDGNVYLADFGIAKDIFRTSLEEGEEKAPQLGTPLFMAPEQFGDNVTVSPQTDMYSLGIVLYTMLTGQIPFSDLNTVEVIRNQLYAPLPPVQVVRPDLPYDVNTFLMNATAKVPEVRFETVTEMAEAFRTNVLEKAEGSGNDSSIASSISPNLSTDSGTIILDPTLAEPQNPYKGLRAFQEADSADFFGRSALIEQLKERLQSDTRHFLAVVGPSGSGKSSVVMAGLLPAIRQGVLHDSRNWFILKMTPGADPFRRLGTTLLQIALEVPENLDDLLQQEDGIAKTIAKISPDPNAEIMIFIDQFEELFTLVQDEATRGRFLLNLHDAITAEDSRLSVVLTLRADFYDRPLAYPEFGALVKDHTEIVLPLTDSELVESIIGPAERQFLEVEPVLVSRLVADVRQQPGMLPLLQYTLTELFEQKEGKILTLAAHEKSGGLTGVLASRAQYLHSELTPERQVLSRQIFLRLVNVREGTEATRRRVNLTELLSLGDADVIQMIIDIFGQFRLLTFDYDPQTREPTVEIAHEALIRSWDSLKDWLAQSRADLLTQRRLATAIREWQSSKNDSSYLASGNRLVEFETLRDGDSLHLNQDELTYIDASITLRRRAANRLRMFIAGLVVITLVSVVATIFALYQQEQTRRQARIARSRELAATALINPDLPNVALQYSLEALNTADTLEAQNSLLISLQNASHLISYLQAQQSSVRSVVYAPDGSLIAAGGIDGTLHLWDATTMQPIGEPRPAHEGWINTIAFSPDSTLIATGSEDGTLRIQSAFQLEEVGWQVDAHNGSIRRVTFSPDGELLVSTGDDGTVHFWDAATGEPDGEPLVPYGPEAEVLFHTVSYSPDGTRLAFGGTDNMIHLWDAESRALVMSLQAHVNPVLDTVFSPDGTLLVSADFDGRIILWNTETGQALAQLNAHNAPIWQVDINPQGTLLATGSADNTIRLWDLTTGQIAAPIFTAHYDVVRGLAFSPDGSQLVSGGQDGNVLLWSTEDPARLSTHLEQLLPVVSAVAVDADWQRIVTANGILLSDFSDNTIHIWPIDSSETPIGVGEPRTLVGHDEVVSSITLSPDGQTMVSGGMDQLVQLWPVGEDGDIADSVGFIGHEGGVLSVAIHPTAPIIASGDDQGVLILWDVDTQEAIGDPLVHGGSILTMAFNPDDKTLAVGSRDGTISLWDVDDHTLLHRIEAHAAGVQTLQFSKDGSWLVSGGRDSLVKQWETATGEMVGDALDGHAEWVTAVSISPDGTRIASGDRNGLIRLWDVQTNTAMGEPLSVGDEHWVIALTFNASGERLLSATDATDVFIWELGQDAWYAAACTIIQNTLPQGGEAALCL